MENLVTHLRRVVRANRSESIIKSSEVHSTLVIRKQEVLITPVVKDYVTLIVKDYATLVVSKNSLTDFSSINNPTLVVSKCNDVILSKFKVVKFMIE